MNNFVRDLRTVKGYRGSGLKIDLGKTFNGTIDASMRKYLDSSLKKDFSIIDNRYLFLDANNTLDEYNSDGDLLLSISGKWNFDVFQTINSVRSIIYTGTIYFENNMTGTIQKVV